MKFINAKFFYKKDELINDSQYSYWWILMGELLTFGSSIGYNNTHVDEQTWNSLKAARTSYKIISSSEVNLQNAYVCGMAKATSIPSVDEGQEENKGTVILNVGGAGSNSIIPFTVGQGMSDVGHNADSLWLIALPKIEDDDILGLFPFEIDSTVPGSETQRYIGPQNPNLDLSDPKKCIPLIGYNVSSEGVVNNIKYSGFTVGNSVVTLSGLITLSNNN